jgi:hypothetical protein
MIYVNLTYPERNREVCVFSFKGLEDGKTGDIVDGFQITMPFDHRDFEFFKLEVVNDNELSLHMPSLPYQMQFDSVSRFETLLKLDLACAQCQQAQEICITDVESAPSRKLKKLILRFPDDVNLVNLASPIDKVIPADILPYVYKTAAFNADDNMVEQWSTYISWKVGNANSRAKAFGKTPQKTGLSKMSSIFAKSCSMSEN